MKSQNNHYQYYVEGGCEKKLIRTLIDHHLIIPGKIDILNPVQENIKITHLRTLSRHTTVILVFDTDKPKTDILTANIRFLQSSPNIRRVVTIPQISNLEQELCRCTDVRHIRDLLNCSHDSDFKSLFISEKRLFEKLQEHGFDIGKLWSSPAKEPFLTMNIQNQGNEIKL